MILVPTCKWCAFMFMLNYFVILPHAGILEVFVEVIFVTHYKGMWHIHSTNEMKFCGLLMKMKRNLSK